MPMHIAHNGRRQNTFGKSLSVNVHQLRLCGVRDAPLAVPPIHFMLRIVNVERHARVAALQRIFLERHRDQRTIVIQRGTGISNSDHHNAPCKFHSQVHHLRQRHCIPWHLELSPSQHEHRREQEFVSASAGRDLGPCWSWRQQSLRQCLPQHRQAIRTDA